MIHPAAIALAFIGFAAIAISMTRHQRRKLPDRVSGIVRWSGFGLLAADFLIDLRVLGPGYGAIAWFGHLTVAAWLVVGTLYWRANHWRAD